MPKLLIFFPARNIVVDKTTNQISTNNIVEMVNVNAGLPEGTPISAIENIKIAISMNPFEINMPWCVFSLWCPNKEDVGKFFYQNVRLYSVSGRMLSENTVRFKFKDTNHRNTVNFPTFPIAGEGVYRLVLSYSEDNIQWTAAADFPIPVGIEFLLKKAPVNSHAVY